MNPDAQDVQDALDLIVLQEAEVEAHYATVLKQSTNQYNLNKKRLEVQKAQLNVQMTAIKAKADKPAEVVVDQVVPVV